MANPIGIPAANENFRLGGDKLVLRLSVESQKQGFKGMIGPVSFVSPFGFMANVQPTIILNKKTLINPFLQTGNPTYLTPTDLLGSVGGVTGETPRVGNSTGISPAPNNGQMSALGGGPITPNGGNTGMTGIDPMGEEEQE